MITTMSQAIFERVGRLSSLRRITAILRWPFTSRYAAFLWLVLRCYLGWTWLQFSISKFRAGWVTHDHLSGILQPIADGHIRVPFEFYRSIAAMLLDLELTPLLSSTMPFLELAIALAFLSGVLVVPAAIGASLLNVNFILSGIALLSFDLRIITLQLLLLLGWRTASRIGLEPLGRYIFRNRYGMIRPV